MSYDSGTEKGRHVEVKGIWIIYGLQLMIAYQYWFSNCDKYTLLIY